MHSTKGFLYINNYEVSKISLSNKFIELACDIILNDEKFDKDGKPSGGDGVYYNWKGNPYPYKLKLNGNGHTIYGLYGVQTEEIEYFNRSLIHSSTQIDRVSNLKFDNVYLNEKTSKYVSAIGYSGASSTIENCDLISGSVVGHQHISGLVGIAKTVRNCNNYGVNIYSSYQWVSGIVCDSYGIVESCNNYADLYMSGTGNNRGGGIVAWLQGNGKYKIKDCTNYGNLYGQGGQTGGIVGWLNGGLVKDCKNYGTIQGNAISGIVGYLAGKNLKIVLDGCENYGYIKAASYWSTGELITHVPAKETATVDELILTNCYVRSVSGLSLLGSCAAKNYVVSNCRFDYVDSYNDYSGTTTLRMFCASYNDKMFTNSSFSNIEINISDKINRDIKLDLGITNYRYVEAKNILVKSEHSKGTVIAFDNDPGKVSGIIVQTLRSKYMFSNDFSGFYIDWKTGNLGLKCFSGRGYFQGEVTESVLLNKGFVKKEIA